MFTWMRDLAKSARTLVREAGLEPARTYCTLEPESSESANSTTRAYYVPTSEWLYPLRTGKLKYNKNAEMCQANRVKSPKMQSGNNIEP